MYRIIVADDHAIVRKGLKMIIEDEPDLVVAEEAEDGDDFLEKIVKGTFDLIILDIGMPGRDVFDILSQLKNMRSVPPILIITMNPEELYAKRLFNLGISGYLNKEARPEEIIRAIRAILQGRLYITPSLAENLAQSMFSRQRKFEGDKLTPREFQVLCHIANGDSLTDISSKLFLSKATVSNHRTNLLKKLQLRNNADLTQYAIKNKIL
ncbi:MAG: response regulator [Chloroflexota bacterium]